MNSFFIPRLGSQIYAMAGMQTQLHPIADEAGTYDGIPLATVARASGMKFKAIATPDRATFDQWVAKPNSLRTPWTPVAVFEKVAVPSEYNKVEYFSNVKPDLFKDVVNKFMSH